MGTMYVDEQVQEEGLLQLHALVTDEASDSDGGAKEVRTTGEPKHYIRLNENRS